MLTTSSCLSSVLTASGRPLILTGSRTPRDSMTTTFASWSTLNVQITGETSRIWIAAVWLLPTWYILFGRRYSAFPESGSCMSFAL